MIYNNLDIGKVKNCNLTRNDYNNCFKQCTHANK